MLLLTMYVIVRKLKHGITTNNVGVQIMVLRGHQLKHALHLKHVPKVRTQFTFHKSGDIVVVTPINTAIMVTSFTYFKVEIYEGAVISKEENCA